MLPAYDKSQRPKVFFALPKGAYVIKILNTEVKPNKNSVGNHIEIYFDVAEGEYADFYKEQYDANLNENKKWSYDAVFNLNIPYDNCPNWIYQNYVTFMADLEDSNDGFVCKDESQMKGKVIGGKFHIEQTEYNGIVYDHTKLKWTCTADAVRQGKAGKLPKDKLYTPPDVNDGFMDIPTTANGSGLPWE